jgi:hypothetical protein
MTFISGLYITILYIILKQLSSIFNKSDEISHGTRRYNPSELLKGDLPMPRIYNFPRVTPKNQTFIATRAREAKRTIKTPYSAPELRLQETGMRPLRTELKREEGSVKLSTLASIPLATIGALLGVGIQSHINKDNLIKAQDLDTSSFWQYFARPETALDYASVASAGLVGLLAGVLVAKFPTFLSGNGNR